MDYLVTPPAATPWGFEPAELAAALRERWPGAEVREVPQDDPTYAIDFTVDEGGRVDGALGRDGQTLGLTGDLEPAMAVAAWFRGQVPDEEPLLFYDPAFNGQVPLTPGIDPAAAARGYLDTPPAATPWGFEPEELAAALRERWPEAEVREVPRDDPTYAIDFTLDEGGRVDGALGRDGQTLGLSGDLEPAMAVAAWFRSRVPDEESLLFYDPAFNGQVPLTPGIDPAAAARAYLDDAG